MKNNKKQGAASVTTMVLNKYLAHAGICSRRKAIDYIKAGQVKVNGTVIKKPSHKVAKNDQVTFNGKPVVHDKKIYILLNKPQGYVTTVAEQQGRRTVIDLVKGAVKVRVYPVGRLDRDTTGLLLITNDGELTQKLAHPKNEVKKVYSVVLDRPLATQDIQSIRKGVRLTSGIAHVDRVVYSLGSRKNCIKIHLHSGKNRIVRKIFEHVGYRVMKLDRINYAGLTRRGLSVGKWRKLNEQEIDALQKIGQVVSTHVTRGKKNEPTHKQRSITSAKKRTTR